MKSYQPEEILEAYRNWVGSIDELAVLATILTQGLGMEPDTSTAAKSRIAQRTIRYYITQGLLSPAEGQTRNAVYTYRHLLELLYIKGRQMHGATLDQIGSELVDQAQGTLEKRVLEHAPARTDTPLPSDAELFDKYNWSTVWNYWTRTSPYRWNEFIAAEGPHKLGAVDATSEQPTIDEARDRTVYQAPADPPPMQPSRPGPWAAESLHRYLHIQLLDDIELVVPEEHELAENPAYRQQLVARLRRWLKEPRP